MFKWIIIAIVTLIALTFVYGWIKKRSTRKKQVKIFKSIFTENYFHRPTIEFGFSYWWPTFKIVFKNKSDFERARKLELTRKFENEIQNIYGNHFDAARTITYEFLSNDL